MRRGRLHRVAESVFEGKCCCRDCHKTSGTGHVTVAAVSDATFHLSDEIRVYVRP